MVSVSIDELWRATDKGRALIGDGRMASFSWPGGRADVEGVRVVAKPIGYHAIDVEDRFILFGSVLDGMLHVNLENLYLVQGNKIRNIRVRAEQDDIEEKTVDQLRAILSESGKVPK